MIDYIFHYYRKGTRPFQSLSVLSDEKAKSIMKNLYIPDSMLWQRFANPEWYLPLRRQTESELYRQFKDKGGLPTRKFPIYFTVGRPKWAVDCRDAATVSNTAEIRVPLSIFSPRDISLTYPDSMLSFIINSKKDDPEYNADYHGKVFLLPEMERLIERDRLPVHDWKEDNPPCFSHYIEVQAWNQNVLGTYLTKNNIVT